MATPPTARTRAHKFYPKCPGKTTNKNGHSKQCNALTIEILSAVRAEQYAILRITRKSYGNSTFSYSDHMRWDIIDRSDRINRDYEFLKPFLK